MYARHKLHHSRYERNEVYAMPNLNCIWVNLYIFCGTNIHIWEIFGLKTYWHNYHTHQMTVFAL